MFESPLLIIAVATTGAVALWGALDSPGLATFAGNAVGTLFASRGWFIMLTASALLITCVLLAFSPWGRIRLGRDEDRPEFSTPSWLTMLFAAGMGVGLLYFGTAEPLTHFELARTGMRPERAASLALFVTNFHWGLHAWAIYAVTGLVIAYFSFRKGWPTLLSSPFLAVFGRARWARALGWVCDLLAIVAIAIGLGGSIAMGVFQVRGGLTTLLGLEAPSIGLAMAIFLALVAAYILPLTVDLGAGMARMSNLAMAIAGGLVLFVLLVGPTWYVMSAITDAVGEYFTGFLRQGFRTYTFFDEQVSGWFQSWTLTYMVWWLAWSPFVGVFIARISKGRTIREYLLGVVLVPTLFSIFWFGAFGAMGFFVPQNGDAGLLEVVKTDFDATTFVLLDKLPLGRLTGAATLIAAFLFIVTSVVSAAFVLGMFSTGGNLDPPVRVKLVWGGILGALGLAMILSGSIDAVKSIIALGAMPFVYIVLLLLVCLLKALRAESLR